MFSRRRRFANSRGISVCRYVISSYTLLFGVGINDFQCDEPYTADNVIPILPTKEADKQQLIERGHKLAEQGLTHSLKKAPGSKKRKKNAANGDATDAGKESKPSEKSSSATASRSNTSTPTPGGSSGIKNAATALLTQRVLEEENEKKKRRKMLGTSDNISSLFTKESKDAHAKNTDFMRRGFSLPAAARK